MQEQWKAVLGYEGAYEASCLGNIRRITGIDSRGRLWPGRTLKPKVGRHNRRVVTLSQYGRRKTWNIATLVCLAFNGPRPANKEVAHNDGRSLNDRAANLRWATRSENEADKIKHGTRAVGKKNGKYTKPEATPRGEQHGCAKLTSQQVIYARKLMDNSIVGSYTISKLLNVSFTTAKDIRNRKTWRHI